MKKKRQFIDPRVETKTITVRLPQTQWNMFVELLQHRSAFPVNASDSLKCTYAIGMAISEIRGQLKGVK